jgi:hypothetical protein
VIQVKLKRFFIWLKDRSGPGGQISSSPAYKNSNFANLANGDLLRGTTLVIYKYLIKNGRPIGPRELQRSLSLSSSGLASFHLDKLERAGLITKNENEHTFTVNYAYLKHYILFRRHLIPRYFFYAMFSTFLFCWWAIYLMISNTLSNVQLLHAFLPAYVFGAVSFAILSAIFWYETFNVLKNEVI